MSACSSHKALLRFFGYLDKLGRVPEGASLELPFLGRADLGDMVQKYAEWLQTTQELRFSSIANYASCWQRSNCPPPHTDTHARAS